MGRIDGTSRNNRRFAGVTETLQISDMFLDKGAIQIASQFDLNDFVSEMITGIILFFILGSEFFINFKVRFRGRIKEAGK